MSEPKWPTKGDIDTMKAAHGIDESPKDGIVKVRHKPHADVWEVSVVDQDSSGRAIYLSEGEYLSLVRIIKLTNPEPCQ